MSLAEKISEAELEVMKILWRAASPVPFSALRAELREKMGWEKSTVATLLRRLQDKGAVAADAQRLRRYTALITKTAYVEAEGKSLIDKLYEGSAKNFVAALCRGGELTEADIDELKVYFRMGGAGL